MNQSGIIQAEQIFYPGWLMVSQLRSGRGAGRQGAVPKGPALLRLAGRTERHSICLGLPGSAFRDVRRT